MNCDLDNDLLEEKLITAFIQKPQTAQGTERIPETPCKTKVLGATNIIA